MVPPAVTTRCRQSHPQRLKLGAVQVGVIDAADEGLATTDPWDGFCEFAERYVQLRAASCGVNDPLGGAHRLDLAASLAVIRRRMKALVQRAQRSGDMRIDVDWRDVPFVLAGYSDPLDRAHGTS